MRNETSRQFQVQLYIIHREMYIPTYVYIFMCVCVCYREKERREGEEKLQRELERVREMARQDFEHTKSYTKELYDRENRSLYI